MPRSLLARRLHTAPPLPPAHTRARALARVVVAALFLASTPLGAAPDVLNGSWTLDPEGSEEFEAAGRALNERLNEELRGKSKQKFARDEQIDAGGNRYQAAAMAAERMIREDMRAYEWEMPKEARPIVEAETIKLYLGRKLAILYGERLRRLLDVSPGGRVYSVRGTEFSDDAVGRSLTWLDGDALVIETELEVGGKLVERFEFDASGSRLVMTVRRQQQSNGPWLEFQRRFARAD